MAKHIRLVNQRKFHQTFLFYFLKANGFCFLSKNILSIQKFLFWHISWKNRVNHSNYLQVFRCMFLNKQRMGLTSMLPDGVGFVISVTLDHLSRTSSGVKESVIFCLSSVPLPRKICTEITANIFFINNHHAKFQVFIQLTFGRVSSRWINNRTIFLTRFMTQPYNHGSYQFWL